MSIATRVLKNTFFLYGKVGVTSICLLLSTRFVLKALGVIDFGIYNLIASTVVMLSFLNESMTAATQRFMSYTEGAGDKNRSKHIFNTSLVIHFIISLVVVVVFIFLHPLFFGGYLQIPDNRINAAKMIYYLMVASTSMTMMTVPYNAVLVAHENMLYYSVIGITSGVLKLLIAVFLLSANGDRLIVYGVLMLGVTMLEWIISRVYCHYHYEECMISPKYVNKGLVREMFVFAGWQFLYSASSILSIHGASLILNSFFGAIMNAAQGVARQVCGQLMTLSGTLMHALNPVIVKKAGSQDQHSMIQVTITGSKLSYMLVIFVAIPVLFELPYLLNIWLERVPEYAIPFCCFEVVQQIFASFTITLVTMINGVGEIKEFQLFSSITYVLRLPLIYLAFRMGANPMYVYYIATAAVIILCVGRVYYANKKGGLPVHRFIYEVIVPCIGLSMIMCASLYIITSLMPSSFLRFCVICIIALIESVVLGYVLVLNIQERMLFQKILKSIKSFIL